MKKTVLFYITLFLCIFLSCNIKKNSIFDIGILEVVEKDSLILKNYEWIKCIINEKDTIIILTDKMNKYSEIQYPIIKIKKINSIIDDIGYRLYNNNIYIDDKLYFPKEMEVYYLNCSESKK
jgi:hypothetical protein